MEELLSQHRKEVKALDGEKRAAIKKAKTTKGKKAKDEISSVEDEFAAKLKDMEERHRTEVAALGGSVAEVDDANDSVTTTTTMNNAEDIAAIERQKKLEKIRIQKEIERQRIMEQEKQLNEDAKNIGPTLRDIELQQIMHQLQPLHYQIKPVTADGNCMFRAIAEQCNNNDNESSLTTNHMSYSDIRTLCAQIMRDHEDDFAPFCEYHNNDDETTNYTQYINDVQYNSQHWGGHLELRAISIALQRPIHIYSSDTLISNAPLIIDGRSTTNDEHRNTTIAEPIRLSYHKHYYALGEHYNQVVPVVEDHIQ